MSCTGRWRIEKKPTLEGAGSQTADQTAGLLENVKVQHVDLGVMPTVLVNLGLDAQAVLGGHPAACKELVIDFGDNASGLVGKEILLSAELFRDSAFEHHKLVIPAALQHLLHRGDGTVVVAHELGARKISREGNGCSGDDR